MGLPQRFFYSMHEAAVRWGCTISDIAGWAAAGKLQIITGIAPVMCGETLLAGQVILSPMELLPMFRRCGTGPSHGLLRHIKPCDGDTWHYITDPEQGVDVSVADMVILGEEVQKFEDDHDLLRRVVGGTGTSSPYDWIGMMIAVILRIHERGIPETQAALVGEMQDWFAQQSEDGQMPDERSIRRYITPIWQALRNGLPD